MAAKNWKKPLIITFLILLILGIGVYIGKIFLEKYIEKVMSTIQIKLDVNKEGTSKAKILLDMKNKMLPSVVDSIQYFMLLDKDTIGRGSKVVKDTESWEDSTMALILTIDQKRYLKRIKSSTGENAQINLNIKVYVLGKLLNKKYYEINKVETFVLPIQPKIEIEKVKFKKFGLKHSEILLNLKITNFNTYEVHIDQLHFNFKIKDYIKAEGKKDGKIKIISKKVSYTQIPIEVDMKHFGKLIREFIKNKKQLPYEIKITCKAKVASLDEPIDIDSNIKGNMEL